MKHLTKILILLIAILAIAIPMLAQDEVSPTASATAVNVRSGDGTQYSMRGVLTKGSLSITGRNNFDPNRVCTGIVETDLDMWLRVDLYHVEGWVARCAVNVTGDIAGLPVVSPSNSMLITQISFDDLPQEQPLGDASVEKFVYGVTRSGVNMREGASIGANVIEMLRAGELVYVVATNDDQSWVKVEIDGKSGWVARYLMSLPKDWQSKLAS